jgi:hypothetical protein
MMRVKEFVYRASAKTPMQSNNHHGQRQTGSRPSMPQMKTYYAFQLRPENRYHEQEGDPLSLGEPQIIWTLRISAQKFKAKAHKAVGYDIPGQSFARLMAGENKGNARQNNTKHTQRFQGLNRKEPDTNKV